MTGPLFHKYGLALGFVKIIVQSLLKHISGHMEEKTEIRNSQYGFVKAQCCLTNLITFHDKMGRSV